MIIDTSVVVKWFYEEAETSTALRLFDKIANHEVHGIIPDLLFYEFANTLKTNNYCGRKTFSYCRGAGNTIITRL